MGLDVGQKRDHTAMAVVERAELTYRERDPLTWAPFQSVEYRLRFLQRMPLGMAYPEMIQKVEQVVSALRQRCKTWEYHGRGALSMALVVDATGVGAPVVDLLKQAQLGCEMTAVSITGGEREVQTREGWSVPKRDLITGLQVMYEHDELTMSKGLSEIEALLTELSDMRVRLSDRGNERFAVWRDGAHDDLVLAVALAVWRAKKGTKSPWGKVRLV
jgi:hypothetical protein